MAIRAFLKADWDDLDPDDAERRLSRYLAMGQSDPTIDHDIELGTRDFKEAARVAAEVIAPVEAKRARIIDMLIAATSPRDEIFWQDQLEKIEQELVSLVA